MTDLFKLILCILASRFKARATLEAGNLVLRQQVNVLRRRTPKRPHLNNTDRFLFVWLYRWFPSALELVAIVRPETIIRAAIALIQRSAPKTPEPDLFLMALLAKFSGYYPGYSREIVEHHD
jgi:hypothetical protein